MFALLVVEENEDVQEIPEMVKLILESFQDVVLDEILRVYLL